MSKKAIAGLARTAASIEKQIANLHKQADTLLVQKQALDANIAELQGAAAPVATAKSAPAKPARSAKAKAEAAPAKAPRSRSKAKTEAAPAAETKAPRSRSKAKTEAAPAADKKAPAKAATPRARKEARAASGLASAQPKKL